MAFQSPKNNTGFQITLVLGAFALICLATAAFFNMSSGEAISLSVSKPGQYSQAFESSKKNQVYFIELRSSTGRLPVNRGWSQAQVEVATEDGQALFAFGGDFWRAEGRDSDGYWSERKNLNNMKVTLRESGTFLINLDYTSSVPDPGQLTIVLHPKRASSLPFFWLGIIAFIGAVVIGYFSSKSIAEQSFRNMDYEF